MLVLGIAGGSASGKSTVADRLVALLGDLCLHVLHDRYYHSLPEDLWPRPVEHNFDHPDALETTRLVRDLRALRAGHPAALPRYDFKTHLRCAEEDVVEPRPVVVVEGILVLADDELRAAMDHCVFVTAPDDIRLMRRIRRDVAERGREVHEILEQYERTVRPMHEAFVRPSSAHADLVLDGTAPVVSLVQELLELIKDEPAVQELRAQA